MSDYSTSVGLASIGPKIDYDAILKGHHSEFAGFHGEVQHVFAIGGPPPFEVAGRSTKYSFDVAIPVGPLVFGLQGSIDLVTGIITAVFYVIIPISGRINLAAVEGDIRKGVSITFGLKGILSGTAKFYIVDNILTVDLSVTIFGKEYGPYTIPLIRIPFL